MVTMGILDTVAAGVVIFLASMAQSAVGFGYALFATPLLIMLGLPLPSAITLVATCSMIQAAIGISRLHAAVPWRWSLTATAVRLASVAVGLLLLRQLVALNTDYIRLAVGAILCLLVGMQSVCKPRPAQTPHWRWAGLAFLSSGFLAGFCGMGGPPLVLWSLAQNWSSRRIRGFLFAVFATSIPVQIVLLSLTFPPSILWNVAIGIALLPLVYLGAAAGLPIGNRMDKERLRRIAYLILLVIGISAMAPAVLSSMGNLMILFSSPA